MIKKKTTHFMVISLYLYALSGSFVGPVSIATELPIHFISKYLLKIIEIEVKTEHSNI